MSDMIMSMKDDLMGLINPSAFTSDSIEGIAIILLFLLILLLTYFYYYFLCYYLYYHHH